MTVRIYRHTDFGAPSVNEGVGQLINLLDKCLVTGYGDQTITITRVGIVGTIVTTSPHGLETYGKYDISGADQSDYNGTHSVDVVDANTLTYTVIGSPVSPATGTITGRMGGAGWSKHFDATLTNYAAFKQGSSGSYLQLDDDQNGYALVRAYETMVDINDGTVRMPDVYWNKASTGTTRPWTVLADENTITYWLAVDGSSNNAVICNFGDFKSYIPGDIYNKILSGGHANFYYDNLFGGFTSLTGYNDRSYLNRGWLKNPSYQNYGRVSDAWLGSECGRGHMPYPTERDNALYTSKIFVNDYTVGGMIGEMKGLINPLHARPLAHNSIFDGIGDLAGRKFLVLNFYTLYQIFFEISDTW